MQTTANIAHTLTLQAKREPNQIAVFEPSKKRQANQRTYKSISYKELEDKANRIAKQLYNTGIRSGTRCVLMVTPSINFFALTFALFKLGSVPVFIDPGLGIKRIGKCIDEVEPDTFIGIPKAHLARRLFSWGKNKLVRNISLESFFPSTINLSKLSDSTSEDDSQIFPILTPEAPAAILYTSGSTGAPKGALYTHANFQMQIQSLRTLYNIQAGEVDLCSFPLFALFAPALGMSAVIPFMNFTKPGSVDPKEIFEPIKKFDVTNLFGSPALLRRLSESEEFSDPSHSQKLFPSLKRIVSAGAPVPSSLIAKLKQRLEARIYTPYGATEALPVANIEAQEILTQTSMETDRGAGVCVGRPIDGCQVKIIQISDTAIAEWDESLLAKTGEVGEIVVCGAQVSKRYYNRGEANLLSKMRQDQQVWHRMGDLGYFDEQGRLWFCGRKAHRVITKKETLFTIPCEAIFNTHPEVFRSALVGLGKAPDQKPVLCVELVDKKLSKAQQKLLLKELQSRAQGFQHTRQITMFLIHPGFPVDIRHNSKIFREKLAIWAGEKFK